MAVLMVPVPPMNKALCFIMFQNTVFRQTCNTDPTDSRHPLSKTDRWLPSFCYKLSWAHETSYLEAK